VKHFYYYLCRQFKGGGKGFFMRKRIINVALIILIVVLSVSSAFATTEIKGEQVRETTAMKGVAIVKDMVGADDVVTDIDEKNKEFVADFEEINISIPKEGKDFIEAELFTGENILMGLPKEVANSKGVLTESGAVVYNSMKENVDVLIQATENEKKSGEKEYGVRAMIIIADAEAPHDYEFAYKLPRGNKFVSGKDLDTNEIGRDEIAIVDEDGFLNGTIKAPWAKDADGKSLETFYKIDGDILIQHIEFDQDSSFPIVADPWYGTSTMTENIGSTFKQGFTAYAAGQGTDGFRFDDKGGAISYTRGSGVTANAGISLGATYGVATLSADIGFAYQGGTTGSIYPVPKKAGWYKLKITEYYNIQKYSILRRWKDPDTGRVTWKEFSRNAKKVSYAGLEGKVVAQ